MVYLDDFLIFNQSKEGAERDFKFTVDLLSKCGFLINWEKSLSVATHERQVLGLIVDSSTLSLSLLPRKGHQIVEMCRKALASKSVSLREISKILGNLAWAIQALPFAQGNYGCLRQF